ncbi:PhoD-like phosphatase N-terminal domain-containing protein [uncultured Pseudokineococcus sp.]|uniref:PhoD-like phosphatase N-terminal domain-containing protein n=1 Tax=uncultured Pseudokineococcus sp. TaxID=1642928 RepID=UPI00262548EB|nr:PhoD-like phosphatase N-terminal domain-containing protein [uncultured Pseudokineococcus sp.]
MSAVVPVTPVERRRFLAAVGGVAGLAAAAQVVGEGSASASVVDREDPFTLGIASGDPAPDGFVLWTRLAPRPFEVRGGCPRAPAASRGAWPATRP